MSIWWTIAACAVAALSWPVIMVGVLLLWQWIDPVEGL